MVVLLLTSPLSAMPSWVYRLAWHKNENENLFSTVFLFLDVSCSGSNSRMRLFPCGGAFYTMIFPRF